MARRSAGRVRCVVVEDDPFAADLISQHLEMAGLDVTVLTDGRAAATTLLADPPDICVLDIDLPSLDGLSILQHLRSNRIDAGVIMVTGRAEDLDRVRGLRMGADDYLGKPFLPAELVARVEALARRLRGSLDDVVEVGALRLDVGARSATWRDGPVDLTKTEFDLLTELARSPGKVLTRGHLLNKVWDLPAEWKADATLTEHVYRLRNKLKGISIVAVRGVGYRLDPEPVG
jgi:DNA-binding response OmpR family regulator